MFNSKNPAPNQVAFYSAVLIGIITAGLLGIFQLGVWQVLSGVILLFIVSFFIFKEALRRFIFRKIKLIYKFIYQTKASKREEVFYKYVLPQKSIKDVEEDVEAWANRTNEEINTLRATETYRREFLQNFSHEIKTPIFAVQGYLSALLDDDMDDAIRNKFLSNAANNIDRMVHLVSDIDDITKLESGEQSLNKQAFIVQDLIMEVYESLYGMMSEKNIKSVIKKGCEMPITVFADKEKIRRVMINLVTNAIRYGNINGNIISSVYHTDGSTVLVEVSDDGAGIAEEHLSRIFERFYRTDTARSRNDGGTGLGLAICKHIIEAHGQSIHVRSKINVGTTIGFTLQAKG